MNDSKREEIKRCELDLRRGAMDRVMASRVELDRSEVSSSRRPKDWIRSTFLSLSTD
jgi:hypothetical protein